MDGIETPTSLKKLKVAELRDKCEALELENKGTKAMLLNRLLLHYDYSVENCLESEDQINSRSDDKSVSVSVECDQNSLNHAHSILIEATKNHMQIESNLSDSEKPELEFDFANEDLIESRETKIDVNPKSIKHENNQISDDWDESETVQRPTIISGNPIELETKAKIEEEVQDYEVKYMEHVHLDPCINDPHLRMEDDEYLTVTNVTQHGLSNFWCGVKGTHGATSGNVQFTCQYLENILPNPKKDGCGFRIGFSSLESSLQLGETGISCGYDSSGKIYANGQIVATYKHIEVGSIVSASINISPSSIIFTFNLNNEDLGHSITLSCTKSYTMFPHIFFKNCKCKVDFTSSPVSSNVSSFESIKDSLVSSPKPPSSFKDCEVLLMVGVIAAGKSTWVKEYLKSASKKYTVLGRAVLFDRWRRDGNIRQHLSERLVTQVLSYLIGISSKRMRNYIIDQTNYSVATRKRRIEQFKEFGTIKAVLVLPRLSEHAHRISLYNEAKKQAGSDDRGVDGKEVAHFKENISLPSESEGFTEIMYVDCDEKTAFEILADYKYDAQRYNELNASKIKITPIKNINKIPRILPPKTSKIRSPNIKPHLHPRRTTSPKRRQLSPRRHLPPSSRRDDRLRAPKRIAAKAAFDRDRRKDEDSPRSHSSRLHDSMNYKPPISDRFNNRPVTDRYRSQDMYRSDYERKPEYEQANYLPRRISSQFQEQRRAPTYHPPPSTNTRHMWQDVLTHDRREPPRTFESNRYERDTHPSEKRPRLEYGSYSGVHKARYPPQY